MRFVIAIAALLLLLTTAILSANRATDIPLYLTVMQVDGGYTVEDLFTRETGASFDDGRYLFNRWIEDEMLLSCGDPSCTWQHVLVDVNERVRPLVPLPPGYTSRTFRFDTTNTLAMVHTCVRNNCSNTERYVLWDYERNRRVATIPPVSAVPFFGERFLVYLGFQQPDGTRPVHYADPTGTRLLYQLPADGQLYSPFDSDASTTRIADWLYISEPRPDGQGQRLLRLHLRTGEAQPLLDQAGGLRFRFYDTNPAGNTYALAGPPALPGDLLRITADGTVTSVVASSMRNYQYDTAGGHLYIATVDDQLWHILPNGERRFLGLMEESGISDFDVRPDGTVQFQQTLEGEGRIIMYDPLTFTQQTYTAANPPPGIPLTGALPGFPFVIWDDDRIYLSDKGRFHSRPLDLVDAYPAPDDRYLAYHNAALNTISVISAPAGTTRHFRAIPDGEIAPNALTWTEHGLVFLENVPGSPNPPTFLMSPDGQMVRPLLDYRFGEACTVPCPLSISDAQPTGRLRGVLLWALGMVGMMVAAWRFVGR